MGRAIKTLKIVVSQVFESKGKVFLCEKLPFLTEGRKGLMLKIGCGVGVAEGSLCQRLPRFCGFLSFFFFSLRSKSFHRPMNDGKFQQAFSPSESPSFRGFSELFFFHPFLSVRFSS
jgi:hypothetical protein